MAEVIIGVLTIFLFGMLCGLQIARWIFNFTWKETEGRDD